MNAIDQLLSGESMKPGLIRTSASTHFGDDDETILIRMKRVLDQLIRDMRTVEIAGIDVVYARLDRLPQYGNRCVNITGRPPDPRTGKLHGAVAHSFHSHRRAGQSEAAREI